MPSLDSFKSRKTLKVGAKSYTYFSLKRPRRTARRHLRACRCR